MSRLIDADTLKKHFMRYGVKRGNILAGDILISDVIDYINDAPTIEPVKGKWIPVSEMLPKEKGWYLVAIKGQHPQVAYFKGKTFPLNNYYHEIVAWMPLPEAYKED